MIFLIFLHSSSSLLVILFLLLLPLVFFLLPSPSSSLSSRNICQAFISIYFHFIAVVPFCFILVVVNSKDNLKSVSEKSRRRVEKRNRIKRCNECWRIFSSSECTVSVTSKEILRKQHIVCCFNFQGDKV